MVPVQSSTVLAVGGRLGSAPMQGHIRFYSSKGNGRPVLHETSLQPSKRFSLSYPIFPQIPTAPTDWKSVGFKTFKLRICLAPPKNQGFVKRFFNRPTEIPTDIFASNGQWNQCEASRLRTQPSASFHYTFIFQLIFILVHPFVRFIGLFMPIILACSLEITCSPSRCQLIF